MLTLAERRGWSSNSLGVVEEESDGEGEGKVPSIFSPESASVRTPSSRLLDEGGEEGGVVKGKLSEPTIVGPAGAVLWGLGMRKRR